MSEAKAEIRTYQSVWEDLSNVDCSDHAETKKVGPVKLTYLSWAWAWQIMMTKYPDMTMEWMEDGQGAFTGVRYLQDGSASVHCQAKIPDGQGGMLSREMWLPVMDHKNNAVKNPDARQVSDAKMRCMVKTFALFGLGLYIYAGEDLPNDPAKERLIETHIKTMRAHLRSLIEVSGQPLSDEMKEDMKGVIGRRDVDELQKVARDLALAVGKAKKAQQEAESIDMSADEEEDSDVE